MNRMIRSVLTMSLVVLLGGCATWSTGSVDTSTAENRVAIPVTQAENIEVLETDVIGRKYQSLGDLSVRVNKTTVFHPSPTKELVNARLRADAAKLGADAVIFATYGTVGLSITSWGSMNGRGRAIRFID